MVLNMIALFSLIASVYILNKADKQKKSENKSLYALAGLILLLWSLSMLFNPASMTAQAMPLVFGITAIGTLQTKGTTQLIFGTLAILILFTIIA